MDNAPPVLPAEVSYVDRSGWLVVLGVVQIVLGVFCGLLFLFAMLAPLLPSQQEIHANQMVMAAFIYGFAGVTLIWLGIGLTKACRWARTLSMLAAWGGLICGIFGIIGMAMIMPHAMADAMDAATMKGPAATPESQAAAKIGAEIGVAFMLIFMAVFFIVLPGVMAWILGRKNVRATCEARHPEPSWTDACPTLVLFVSLWQAFGAATSLCMGLFGPHAFPLFGVLLTGWSAGLAAIAIGAVTAWCAWLLYRLRVEGWWISITTMLVFTASGIISSFKIDQETFQRALGQSDASIEALKKMGPIMENIRLIAPIAGAVPYIILFILIRKHFRPAASAQTRL